MTPLEIYWITILDRVIIGLWALAGIQAATLVLGWVSSHKHPMLSRRMRIRLWCLVLTVVAASLIPSSMQMLMMYMASAQMELFNVNPFDFSQLK